MFPTELYYLFPTGYALYLYAKYCILSIHRKLLFYAKQKNKAKIKLFTNTSSFSQPKYYYYSCKAVHVPKYSEQVQSIGTQLSVVDAISTATTRTEI